MGEMRKHSPITFAIFSPARNIGDSNPQIPEDPECNVPCTQHRGLNPKHKMIPRANPGYYVTKIRRRAHRVALRGPCPSRLTPLSIAERPDSRTWTRIRRVTGPFAPRAEAHVGLPPPPLRTNGMMA
jgi:hypothetical protein